jgi:hypothetical protein
MEIFLTLPAKHIYALHLYENNGLLLKKQAHWQRHHFRFIFRKHFFRTLA